MNDDNPKPPIWYPILEFFERVQIRVGEAFGSMAEFWEWAFGTAMESLGRAFSAPFRFLSQSRVAKSTQQITASATDNSMDRFFQLREFIGERIFPRRFFWPFHWLAERMEMLVFKSFDLGRAMAGRIFPWRLFYWFAERMEFLAFKSFDFGRALAERVFPRRLFWPFHWLAEQMERFVFEAFDFGTEWFYSRDFRKLIWATPAVLLSAPLVIALVMGVLYSPNQKIRHYEIARQAAIEADDHERAQFLLTRLSQLGYRHEKKAQFAAAMALLDENKKEEAVAAVRELAPESEPGFAEAHLWLAAAVLDGQLESEAPWASIETHANHALQLEPNHPLAKRFLLECKMQAGKIDEAVAEMDELKETFPDLNAELAHQFAIRGELEKARKCARDAVKFHESLLAETEQQAEQQAAQQPDQPTEQTNDAQAESDSLTSKGYLRIAQAYQLTNREEQEIALLRKALQVYPDSEAIRVTLIDRLEQLTRDFRLSNTKDTEYLRHLLQVSPLHKRGMNQVIAMARENGEREQAFLQSLASDPTTPPMLTKALGDVHLSLKQYEQAKVLYVLTCERDAKMAYSWNNLAWLYSNADPIDLQKSLEHTDRALAAKEDANFYETRGQILMKMKRWDEALENLEQAIRRAVPNPENAHRSLAMIYDELNQPEQAAAHRAIAER